MTGDELRAASAAVQELFARVPDGAAAVPLLATDVLGVAAHITSCLTWYAADLVAGPVEVSAFDLVRRPDTDLAEMRAQLGAAAVPLLATDVLGVAAHITSCLTWYAADLVAGPVEVSAFDLVRRPDTDLAEMRAQLGAAAEVLARVVDAAGPAERGAHSWGLADASGFAGMGCAELLLHAWDVADGRGLDWAPPAALASATVARLFPWAPADPDPWAALLWATGRGELPGRDAVTSWRWHCAPLSEWDGTQPAG